MGVQKLWLFSVQVYLGKNIIEFYEKKTPNLFILYTQLTSVYVQTSFISKIHSIFYVFMARKMCIIKYCLKAAIMASSAAQRGRKLSAQASEKLLDTKQKILVSVGVCPQKILLASSNDGFEVLQRYRIKTFFLLSNSLRNVVINWLRMKASTFI